ncbi:small auxin-up RNA [Tanacetum coccineum]|uniref:Small auxin-up RNA n=1 Tax=Tanacetum coccineum TaxID=301880 RepID=A0ABQ5FUR3_9ASTR
MGAFRFQSLVSNAKQLIKLNNNHQRDVPKGYLAVYVGEDQRKRFVVPLSYLDQPLFQELLRRSEEDFGFNHPMGGLTIPCPEEASTWTDISQANTVSFESDYGCPRPDTPNPSRKNRYNPVPALTKDHSRIIEQYTFPIPEDSIRDLDNSTSNVLIPLDSWTSGLLVYKLPLSAASLCGNPGRHRSENEITRDTKGVVYGGIPSALGVSARKEYHVSSLDVP